MVQAAGGADDAASPGPMCRRDGGGRHDRPSDSGDSPPRAIAEQSNRCPPADKLDLDFSIDAAVESATPHRMSCSETSTRSRPKRRSTSSRITTPATIVGARSGSRPGISRALGERHGGEPVERSRRAASRGEHVALDPRRVVRLEREVDRGALGRRCRRRRSRARSRATSAGTAPRGSRARRRRARRAPRGVGGSWCRWRSVWRTTPIWVETWKRTAPRAPTTSSVEPPPMSITSSGSRVGRARRSRRGRSAAPPRRRSACARRGRSASRTRAANSAPLAASRTADVSTATRALGAVRVDRLARSSSSTSSTRCCGLVAEPAGARRRPRRAG